jgi:hypothetical protein
MIFQSEPLEKEIMLTGRAAEMAGYISSDEEPDSYNSSSHRFSNPDQVKLLLRSKNLGFNIYSNLIVYYY